MNSNLDLLLDILAKEVVMTYIKEHSSEQFESNPSESLGERSNICEDSN